MINRPSIRLALAAVLVATAIVLLGLAAGAAVDRQNAIHVVRQPASGIGE